MARARLPVVHQGDSVVSIIEIKIFTKIERDRKSNIALSNLSIGQSANSGEHWTTELAVDGTLISPLWRQRAGNYVSWKSVAGNRVGWVV